MGQTLDLKVQLVELLDDLHGLVDGAEPVDELEHALQCATNAIAEGADDELVMAALLHDSGRAPLLATRCLSEPHERVGAMWVTRAISPRAGWLVAAHVPAKLHLVASDPSYARLLSAQSALSLQAQEAVPGEDSRSSLWSSHRWWPDALRLRRWDDRAKTPGAPTVDLEELLEAAERCARSR